MLKYRNTVLAAKEMELQQHHAAIQVLARHVETLEEEASWRALQ